MDEDIQYTDAIIKKEGSKWVIYSHDGKKKLGEYTSHKAAVKRLQQIEFFKHKGKSWLETLKDAFNK